MTIGQSWGLSRIEVEADYKVHKIRKRGIREKCRDNRRNREKTTE